MSSAPPAGVAGSWGQLRHVRRGDRRRQEGRRRRAAGCGAGTPRGDLSHWHWQGALPSMSFTQRLGVHGRSWRGRPRGTRSRMLHRMLPVLAACPPGTLPWTALDSRDPSSVQRMWLSMASVIRIDGGPRPRGEHPGPHPRSHGSSAATQLRARHRAPRHQRVLTLARGGMLGAGPSGWIGRTSRPIRHPLGFLGRTWLLETPASR
jgi:hypothetical protein